MENGNNKKNRRMSHIKNLYSVAVADGELDNLEEAFLFARAASFNIPKEEVIKLMIEPSSVKFYPPAKFGNKMLQMHDLVHMMLLDGKIHEAELAICKEIAEKLNILPGVVDGIIKDIMKPTVNNEPVPVVY